jgi:uncharacterized protein
LTDRVVVDTNVWISAALSADGASAQVVNKVLSEGIPVFSDATFEELELRLWKPKFDRYLSLEVRRAILHDAKAVAEWVKPPPVITSKAHSRDPDDDKFIHAALAASAPWLVTGDQDLLVLASGIKSTDSTLHIVSPVMALKLLDFCFSQ